MPEAINNTDIRANNARKIIFTLRKGESTTKKELAEQLNLSLPTITNISKLLVSEGFIRECGSVSSAVGRKAALISLNKDACYAIGIHVQTFSYSVAVTDFGGELLSQETVSLSYKGTEHYWREISAHTDALIRKLGLSEKKIAGVRIAVPEILFPNHWSRLGMKENTSGIVRREQVCSYFSHPTELISVAKAAGVARIWYGEIENRTVVIELARYIDGCLISRNPLTGVLETRSFDLGHISINNKGRQCFCGKKGCIQAYCSTSVIIDEINGIDTSRDVIPNDLGKNLIHWDRFVEEMEKGNQAYKERFDEFLNDLAYFINNLRISFEADIVICGDITGIIENYRSELVRKIRELRPSWKRPEDVDSYLHTSTFKRYQACAGAALSVFDDRIEKI